MHIVKSETRKIKYQKNNRQKTTKNSVVLFSLRFHPRTSFYVIAIDFVYEFNGVYLCNIYFLGLSVFYAFLCWNVCWFAYTTINRMKKLAKNFFRTKKSEKMKKNSLSRFSVIFTLAPYFLIAIAIKQCFTVYIAR